RPALRDMFGLDDERARCRARLDGKLRAARRRDGAGTLLAQRIETAQPPLIAPPPGRNAFARPLRLLLDQPVELVRDGRFVGEYLLRPLLERGKALVETAHDAPVNPQTARREPPQKGAVVT